MAESGPVAHEGSGGNTRAVRVRMGGVCTRDAAVGGGGGAFRDDPRGVIKLLAGPHPNEVSAQLFLKLFRNIQNEMSGGLLGRGGLRMAKIGSENFDGKKTLKPLKNVKIIS